MEQLQRCPYYSLVLTSSEPNYLSPYLNASRKYGAGFGTLLWASPKTQATRFAALLQAAQVQGRRVMDVGCGRADFLEYMHRQLQIPFSYVGIEAVEALALAADRKHLANCEIVRGDFVMQPGLLNTAADILFYSGSLNTMDSADFFRCLGRGLDAAGEAMVFNFLCSPFLAGSSHLTWHPVEEVMQFARQLSPRVKLYDRYMRGDATIAIFKDQP